MPLRVFSLGWRLELTGSGLIYTLHCGYPVWNKKLDAISSFFWLLPLRVATTDHLRPSHPIPASSLVTQALYMCPLLHP